MKTLFVLTSVMAVLFLAAPNKVEAQKRKAATPIETTVNAYLRYRVTTESGGALSLASFRKTNGYERGYGLYVIEWQGDISVMQDIWKGGNLFVGYFQDFRVTAQEPGTLESIGQSPKHFNKGTTIRLTGDSVLRKTEQGWRLEGLSVKTAEVMAGPIANGASRGTSPLYVAPDGEFSYSPPDGWSLRLLPQGKYQSAFGPKSNDGSSPSITVGDILFSGTLDDFVPGDLQSIRSELANFRVLSQSEFMTAANQRGIKVVTQSQWGEKWVRTTLYFFDGRNGKKFEVGCSVVTPGGEAYDKTFEKSMKTFKAPA
jgi:hypothetical protein